MGRTERTRKRARRPKRALLVGLTPFMMRLLEGPLGAELDVSAVPFPGTAFDQWVKRHKPDLVVVDVTYLDEARVRPLMMERFSAHGSVLAFVAESGAGWVDDLSSGVSRAIEPVTASALLEQLRMPKLMVVPA